MVNSTENKYSRFVYTLFKHVLLLTGLLICGSSISAWIRFLNALLCVQSINRISSAAYPFIFENLVKGIENVISSGGESLLMMIGNGGNDLEDVIAYCFTHIHFDHMLMLNAVMRTKERLKDVVKHQR